MKIEVHEFLFVAGGGIGGLRTSTHPTLAKSLDLFYH